MHLQQKVLFYEDVIHIVMLLMQSVTADKPEEKAESYLVLQTCLLSLFEKHLSRNSRCSELSAGSPDKFSTWQGG